MNNADEFLVQKIYSIINSRSPLSSVVFWLFVQMPRSNSERKFEVLTIDMPWVRLLNLCRYLLISSAILKLSYSSYYSPWACKLTFSLNLRQASGLISIIKLLETIKFLKGECCWGYLSRLLWDLTKIEYSLGILHSFCWSFCSFLLII